MFWLSALSYKLLGYSNFSYKLPVFLFSLAGIFFTYKLGQSTAGKEAGRKAALFTAFSVIFILYNQDLHTDTVLFTTSALALWLLHEYIKNQHVSHLILSGFALGLCLLTKGPFGVMLPFLSVVAFLLSQKKWKIFFNLRWLLMIGIAFLVASPVFYQMYNNWGFEGIRFFFFGNTIGRFTGSYLGHTPDPTFYFHNMAYLLLPWTIVFFAGLYQHIRRGLRKTLSPGLQYLTWGFVVFLLLISISVSKLPNYLMAALPLMTVIMAVEWNRLAPYNRLFFKIQQAVIVLIWILGAAAVYFFGKKQLPILLPLLATGFLVVHYTTKKYNTERRLLLRSLTALTVLGLLLNLMILPVLFGYQAQPRAAAYLNQLPDSKIHLYNYQKSELKHLSYLWDEEAADTMQFNQTPAKKHFSFNYELLFYCRHQAAHIERPEELKAALAMPDAWFFTDEEGKADILSRQERIDTIISYQHFSLKRTAKYLFPDEGKSPFVARYLIHLPNPETENAAQSKLQAAE
jgi:4-amino-4-deoxy-L-arabinose transferase-like glycosyltransferase